MYGVCRYMYIGWLSRAVILASVYFAQTDYVQPKRIKLSQVEVTIPHYKIRMNYTSPKKKTSFVFFSV